MSRADTLFQGLKKFMTAALPRDRQSRDPWISERTWKLVDELAAMRREQPHLRARCKQLSWQISQSFRADRLAQTRKAGETIESLVRGETPGGLQGAWDTFKGWYREASKQPPKPSRIELERMSAEYAAFYAKGMDLPPESIPVLVAPANISDHTPQEDEIAAAVRRLRPNRAPGPSGMKSDHLKRWLADTTREENPDGRAWTALVELVQHVYSTGDMPVELSWGTMILLPKGEGQYRGIGLLEIVWKLITNIIDARIKAQVEFHDSLHGFRAKRGTATAIIETKLLQQLATAQQSALFTIFLDLRKAYNTLDRERVLDILEGYGVGPAALRLLRIFWDRQQVIAKQSGYYGNPFRATRGVTQGDIISPTIFNIICDAIVRYWLSIVSDVGTDAVSGMGSRIVERSAFFYADDGAISSRDPEWLQRAIDVLADLFGHVGLKTNTEKTEVMTCHPGYICTGTLEAAYGRRMHEEGPCYRERSRRRVECPECKAPLTAGSLGPHMQRAHGKESLPEAPPPMRVAATSVASFPRILTDICCPVEGCTGRAKTRSALRRHFAFRHPRDSLCILEEGPDPLPKCEMCGMHVPSKLLIGVRGHRNTACCRDGTERRRQRQAAEDARRAREVVFHFTVYDQPLNSVETFKYLGRPLSSTDSDWPAVYRNIAKARQKWGMAAGVLARQGASPRISSMFYKAVVQSDVLYGAETWVITPTLLKLLEAFHHRVARQMTGKRPKLDPRSGMWTVPPIAEALEAAALLPIQDYIQNRQNRIADYVATQPILELCTAAGRQRGSPPNRRYWWEQAGVAELV